jgi:hypothetical protein
MDSASQAIDAYVCQTGRERQQIHESERVAHDRLKWRDRYKQEDHDRDNGHSSDDRGKTAIIPPMRLAAGTCRSVRSRKGHTLPSPPQA